MNRERYVSIVRSLHQLTHGAHEKALQELAEVAERAAAAGETTWAAMLLWHAMIVAERMEAWERAAELGERVLRLQDDAYLRLFLFRAYRNLGQEDKAFQHLRASVDLADETRDQAFMEALVHSASREPADRRPDESTLPSVFARRVMTPGRPPRPMPAATLARGVPEAGRSARRVRTRDV